MLLQCWKYKLLVMSYPAAPATPLVAEARSPEAGRDEWLGAARRVRVLSWISLAWMGAEGAVAMFAGVLAGSIALIGFGIDSAVEGLASAVIIWRFSGHRLLSDRAEGRAQRLVASSSSCSLRTSPPRRSTHSWRRAGPKQAGWGSG